MGYSVRTQRAGWRYTEWDEGPRRGGNCADEKDDLGELHNLASDPKHAKVVAEMQRLMKGLVGRQGE